MEISCRGAKSGAVCRFHDQNAPTHGRSLTGELVRQRQAGDLPVTAFFSLSASHCFSAADLPAISSTHASSACRSACTPVDTPVFLFPPSFNLAAHKMAPILMPLRTSTLERILLQMLKRTSRPHTHTARTRLPEPMQGPMAGSSAPSARPLMQFLSFAVACLSTASSYGIQHARS